MKFRSIVSALSLSIFSLQLQTLMSLQSSNISCITITSFMKLHRSIVGDIICRIQIILVESVKLEYVIYDLEVSQY